MMNLVEIESMAAAAFDGGWRSADRNELKKEYQLTDEEADAMVEKLAEYESQYVKDEDGNEILFEAAVNLMDDDLREALHRDMAPCTNQAFYDEYVKRHSAKFNGEKFQVN